MVDETYISKDEALKKGYKKRRQGGYYKQSILDKYLEKGWLELENSHFSAEDRKKAGELLRKDFYLSNYKIQPVWTIPSEVNDNKLAFYFIKAETKKPYEAWQKRRLEKEHKKSQS